MYNRSVVLGAYLRVQTQGNGNMPRGNSQPKQITWKKRINKIPNSILTKIQNFKSDDIVASCAVKVSTEDIESGKYRHLGITSVDSITASSSEVMPDPTIGTYSKRNAYGYEVVHKDRPKTTVSWSIEAPNYGDSSKGYHSIDYSRPAYQRENIPPRMLTIKTAHIAEDPTKQTHVLKFTVQDVLSRKSDNFEENLFFNLNLLQENTGNHDVYESETSLDEYLKTLYVSWEILPPGERDENLLRILGSQTDNPNIRGQVVDRYDFLNSLRPRNFIRGTSEFRRYFGAQFAEDLVVFENTEYGNAIYVMYGSWQELSQKSRLELLSSKSTEFDRIRHTKTWKHRLRALLHEELKKRKQL